MTAHRVVTLTCDKTSCHERYVGAAGANPSTVRAEARRVAGWSQIGTFDGRADLCRWHT